MFPRPETVRLESLMGRGVKIWIYGWNDQFGREQIFAIEQYAGVHEIGVSSFRPIIISLPHPQFANTYNHITLIVNNLPLFKSRLDTLSKLNGIYIWKMEVFPEGQVIIRDFDMNEIMDGQNSGMVVKIYTYEAQTLFSILQNRTDYFFIVAFARYKSVMHCLLNHIKHETYTKTGVVCSMRSLFRIGDCLAEMLQYASNDENPALIPIMQLRLNYLERNNEGVKEKEAISCTLKSPTGEMSMKTRQGREREFLYGIFEMLNKDLNSLIIVSNHENGDIGYLNERCQLHGIQNSFPPWKVNVVIGNKIKLSEIPVILSLIDESPRFSPPSDFHFSVTKMTVSLLESFNQSIVFAPLCHPFSFDGIFMGVRSIPGGLVLEPKPGRHENVVCLDFESLYPNIIANFGIVKGRICRISETEYAKNVKRVEKHFQKLDIVDEDGNIFISQIGKAPIQVFCQFLMNKRRLNPEVGCLKQIVNCLYGLYANNRFSLYSQIAATAVTKIGRFFLKRAIEFFQDNFHCSCIYGDTDSLFLVGRDMKAQILMEEYNKKFFGLKLKIEADFERIILIRKKLYFGKEWNDNYKFSGFSRDFLYSYRKFMCCLIDTSELTLEKERTSLMINTFFDNFEKIENSRLHWNSFLKPLLLAVKEGEINRCERFRYNFIEIAAENGNGGIRLNEVVFPSKYTNGIVLKERGKSRNIIFANFTKFQDKYFLELENAPRSNERNLFGSLIELETQLLIPLLGKSELSKTTLYIRPLERDQGKNLDVLSLSLYLGFVFDQIQFPHIWPDEMREGGFCFVLPLDIIRI